MIDDAMLKRFEFDLAAGYFKPVGNNGRNRNTFVFKKDGSMQLAAVLEYMKYKFVGGVDRQYADGISINTIDKRYWYYITAYGKKHPKANSVPDYVMNGVISKDDFDVLCKRFEFDLAMKKFKIWDVFVDGEWDKVMLFPECDNLVAILLALGYDNLYDHSDEDTLIGISISGDKSCRNFYINNYHLEYINPLPDYIPNGKKVLKFYGGEFTISN